MHIINKDIRRLSVLLNLIKGIFIRLNQTKTPLQSEAANLFQGASIYSQAVKLLKLPAILKISRT